MKKALIFVIGITVAACSTSLTYLQAIEKNRANLKSSDMESDAQFLVEAKSFSVLEYELGKLASEKGYAAAVQFYGQKIVKDHEEMNDRLNKLASANDIKVPSVMSEGHLQKYEQVASADRSKFDEEFIGTIEDIYESHINLFKQFATSATDDDVRAFAAKYLGLVRSNEEEADAIEGELL